MTRDADPRLPDYSGACTSNVVPELIKALMKRPTADWMPRGVSDSNQVVLLVIDGLGWEQLQSHGAMAPTLVGFEGGPISTVAPTTTATALTSIVTGRPPAVHGVLGYRLAIGENDVLDLLKWQSTGGDARSSVPPTDFQVQPAFAGNSVPVVTRREFVGTGFTDAHMQGARLIGYSVPSSLPLEVWRLAKEGEEFIYAYYDGLDKIAHAKGLGDHYDAELYTVDRMVRDLVAGLPKGCTLVITADHGQVEVGDRIVDIPSEVIALCNRYSGEGRFRWLHANPGSEEELLRMCREHFSDLAWVHSRSELVESGWFGGSPKEDYLARLGDVALIAAEPVAFKDPSHDGEHNMACRHGSLTAAEVLVPILVSRV